MNPKGPGMPRHHPQQSPVVYFLPGEIILHLEHSPSLEADELERELGSFLNGKHGALPWTNELLSPAAGTFNTFRHKRLNKAISLVPARLKDQKAGQETIVDLLQGIHHQNKGINKDGIVEISTAGGMLLRLTGASPNWLAGGVPHGIGVPCPGNWPEVANESQANQIKFVLKGENQAVIEIKNNQSQGAGVHVAILDTAPCLSDIPAAYEKWRIPADDHPHPDDSEPNQLIDNLLCEGGPLHVYPASLEEQRQAAAYTSMGHPYPMRDHGLFVAGIIHTLAPNATLHLYEVMNPYGIGCVTTITKALSQILEKSESLGPMLVNCSLALSISRDGHPAPEYPGEFVDPGLRVYMDSPYQEIFDRLSDAGIVVVAASGNDAQDGSRPPARYPAAFKSVIGVGALPPENSERPRRKASYSNQADFPQTDGYATLGGEAGAGNGVLGIFINPVPKYDGAMPPEKREVRRDRVKYDNNKSGWVRWAGTSFAAPVITGILARAWNTAAPPDLDEAKSILDDLAETEKTDANEKVILVAQE